MKTKLRRIMAGILTALTVLSISGAALAVDADEPCTLTIAAGSESQRADLKDSNVVIDIYRVADIKADESRDTYKFVTNDETQAYAKLDFQGAMASETAWSDIAAQAAKIAMSETAPQTPVLTVPAGTESAELRAGLYLLIPHTQGETADTYFDRENGVSIIYSRNYKYTYAPELIALPTKAGGNTADSNGDWNYHPVTELKPAQEQRNGSLEIIKNLNGYLEAKGKTTFVFEIVGEKDGAVVYSDVVSMDFTDSGTGRIVIDDIPMGTVVTVREVYSGASYRQVSDDPTPVIIPAEGIASVEFDNDYQTTYRSGHGIENTFRYESWTDEQGEHNGWHWIRPEGVDGF